ncbi:MAG: UdgX family uracil-DNA binding protein [Bdellovibrio sp.]|nr:UdgX family uracil-DNA binding protein [Bdellovibrio sp.]
MSSTKDKKIKAIEVAAERCRNCDLYRHATQVVFGSGNTSAKIMIVGEQPGNAEDLAGVPFVGPAGGVLKHCLEEAGIREDEVYLTNAVKHFKHHISGGGKRRLHDRPNAAEVKACHPWLEKELAVVRPKIIVALGLTAARSVLGRTLVISKERGEILDELEGGARVIISWHPSAILRSISREQSAKMRQELVKDLKLAKKKTDYSR